MLHGILYKLFTDIYIFYIKKKIIIIGYSYGNDKGRGGRRNSVVL